MKQVILFLILLISFAFANAQIADVQQSSSWISVYDANGVEISAMPSSGKEVVAVASNFFVVVTTSWISVYDEKCKEISSMPSSGKTVRGAAGNYFTVKSGSWIVTYDKNCREISSRPFN